MTLKNTETAKGNEMTEQERTQGIGAADFHWPYPMEGGYDSSAGHVYAQAIRGANEMRRSAFSVFHFRAQNLALESHPGHYQPGTYVWAGERDEGIPAWTR